jgi:hypothetical protein
MQATRMGPCHGLAQESPGVHQAKPVQEARVGRTQHNERL